jgi:aldose sugar dehydrogenase
MNYRSRMAPEFSRPVSRRHGTSALLLATLIVSAAGNQMIAQDMPTVEDNKLAVRIAASGFALPTTMAFLSDSEMLVLEKATGKVQYVVNGNIVLTSLDLSVNNASERGLLGIALDPNFETNHFVYLYWTCPAEAPADPYTPTAETCPDPPALGPDVSNILAVPLRGNRVDRFVWNPVAKQLTFERNLIKLRAFQNDGGPIPAGQADAGQPPAGNHNGGIITFGRDGKLYIIIGDNGRRGQMQNLPSGPTPTGGGPAVADDQFGGPQPDNAHLTGVVLRLNGDGTTPADNPFFATGGAMGGEVGANIQKVFAYGIRNSFGMAVDHVSGKLWTSENGDNSFDELNIVEPGFNSGWVQIMGPVSRLAEFKAIETSAEFFGLQQRRWPPTNIANSQAEALARLYMLPGARYSDPEFSWKYAIAPAAIGFMEGSRLGSNYRDDLFVGMSTPRLLGGALLHMNLTGNRNKIGVDDDDLEDRVADNTKPHDSTESESLVFGRNFGVVTDIETGPNGNLFVVSLSHGRVYEIYSTREEKGGKKGRKDPDID